MSSSPSPIMKRKNGTIVLASSPNNLMNPFLTFMHTNKSSIIQRTLQSRKLFNKINRVNANITDQNFKWNTIPSITDPSCFHEKFITLMNKKQTPLQINSKIKMRKVIENVMKMNNPKINSIEIPKPKKRKMLTPTSRMETRPRTDMVDLKSINKSIKTISQISKYFDKVYKIDKKQKYLKIETIDYWNGIVTTPSKKKELIEIYNKVHRDAKFTFSDYQREYEDKWLSILKNLQEKDKSSILFLINGGHHEDADEDQVRLFDPSKIIQKLEFKKSQDEKKNQKKKLIFLPKSELSINKTLTISKDIDFQTQRQWQSSQPALNQYPKNENNVKDFQNEKKKNFSAFPDMNAPNIRVKEVSSFDQIKDLNSPTKSNKNKLILKNFLKENLKNEENLKISNGTPLRKSKILSEEIIKKINPLDKKIAEGSNIKKRKNNDMSKNISDFQECDCKHAHNIQCYRMKTNYKSIFKIPSVLPPTKKTFMEIRRASMLEEDIIKIQKQPTFQQKNQALEEENKFLNILKTNIDETYENKCNSPIFKSQRTDFILEK